MACVLECGTCHRTKCTYSTKSYSSRYPHRHVTLTPHYLGVPLAELLDIVVEVERNYKRDIPYHNFRHAVDVTHTLFYMLRDLGAVRFFVQIDLVAVLFAAVGETRDVHVRIHWHDDDATRYPISSVTILAILASTISTRSTVKRNSLNATTIFPC